MREPKEPVVAQLICGILFSNEQAKNYALDVLIAKYGSILHQSEIVDYIQSSYYNDEMGNSIKRQYLAFSNLIHRVELPNIKLDTIALEKEIAITYAEPSCRVVNIDPGYLLAEKMVLATTKNYTHRIYLQKGIYADLTLMVQGKRLAPLPWTYPDYATSMSLDFFSQVRSMYLDHLRNTNE